MMSSKVLLVGLTGLGVEIAKNIILAGIGSLDVMDDVVVSDKDLEAQFCLNRENVARKQTRASASSPMLQELNTLMRVQTVSYSTHAEWTAACASYNLVCLVDVPTALQRSVAESCRLTGCHFVAASSFGLVGYFVLDFGSNFEFAAETKSHDGDAQLGVKRISAPSFQQFCDTDVGSLVRAVPMTIFIKGLYTSDENTAAAAALASQHGVDAAKATQLAQWYDAKCQLTPVCAIVGGFCSQEIVKLISKRDEPVNNVFVYDGLDSYAATCDTIPASL
eukprot:ANDGO_03909.mRNA.2 SUMO-activating enzyme subunit 1